LAYKIIITQEALADLEGILNYIGADNPEAAARFGNALLNHAEILAAFPHIGAPLNRRKGVRSMLHTPVRIYYLLDQERQSIEILHFWHGSRRFPAF
jgi:toxin ParE1/3/4